MRSTPRARAKAVTPPIAATAFFSPFVMAGFYRSRAATVYLASTRCGRRCSLAPGQRRPSWFSLAERRSGATLRRWPGAVVALWLAALAVLGASRTAVLGSGLGEAAQRPVARQAGGLAGALCRPGSQWQSLLWIVWTAWTGALAARRRCGQSGFPVLGNWSPPMHAPERWPYGEIESWWAWRAHLDRVQDPNIATLKREADCEIARILRCCKSRWEPKRPARLVPGRVGVVRG